MSKVSNYRFRTPLHAWQRRRIAIVQADDGRYVVVREGKLGCYEFNKQPTAAEVAELNLKMGVSEDMADAMLAGSLFGWDQPCARPGRYYWNTENEPLIKADQGPIN